MTDAATSYDDVAYPSGIFRHAHPDRLAVLARLVGLDPPPPETARVLEVAGGDGLNAIAFAAAYPQAQVVNFDLAASAIAKGRGWTERLGLANMAHHAADLMQPGLELDGPFDYIVAHGLYAWVPDAVRAAVLPFIAARLAPGGVAFLSFDCLPGSYARVALRSIMHFAGAHPDAPPPERVAAARGVMRQIADRGREEHPADHPWHQLMGHMAEMSLGKRSAVLLHDDIGEEYHPRMLTDVVAEAQALGLTFLCDALDRRLGELFLPADATDLSGAEAQKEIVRRAQANDITDPHFFRRALFTTTGRDPLRRLDPGCFDTLWLGAPGLRREEGKYVGERQAFELPASPLADLIEEAMVADPQRVPLRGRIREAGEAAALFALFDADLVHLATGPTPACPVLSDRPVASPLARLMAAEGMNLIPTLDHRSLSIEGAACTLLQRLDGSFSRQDLRDAATRLGFADAAELDAALDGLRRMALLSE